MDIEIREVNSKKDLKTFVKLPYGIYEGNNCWVPPLIVEEMETFNKRKNPAYEKAESRLFLAYKNGKPKGRIAAILSHTANEKYNSKNLRFGWFEAINNYEIARALFDEVENWGRELGMETLTGPHGFSDLDPEGMLIEGFDRLATIAAYYNHSYYNELVKKYGFSKDIDYIEFTSRPQEHKVPQKLLRIAERIKERGNIRILKFKNKKELMGRAEEIFHVLNDSFEEIYGTVPLTGKQIQYYVKKFFPFVDKDLIQAAVNIEGEIVGFLIAMPSLSKAFQKSKGKLLPFGWIYILKALKKFEIMDFCLAGVRKKYRGQGVDLLMIVEVTNAAVRKGVISSESNYQLEDNKKILAEWKLFNPVLHKRRRIYKKNIS